MPDQNDDKVGYKLPPKHTRFVKGRSGNPKGRPKKAIRHATAIEEVFDETVAVQDANGATTSMSGRALMYRGLTKKALEGNVRAARTILDEFVRLADIVGADQRKQPEPRAVMLVYESGEDWETACRRTQKALIEQTRQSHND